MSTAATLRPSKPASKTVRLRSLFAMALQVRPCMLHYATQCVLAHICQLCRWSVAPDRRRRGRIPRSTCWRTRGRRCSPHRQIANLFSVAGKHAVVTGGGRGIGLMFAEALVANGATVYITSRSADACNEAAAKLSDTHASTGGTCVSLPHDLSNESGCLDFVSDLKERTDKLNVLINNSGVTWGEPLDSYPDKGAHPSSEVPSPSSLRAWRCCMGWLTTC